MQRWNPFETAIGVNNAASLGLKWKNPIGGYGGGLESSPAVVNGVMYFGSDDSNVYALNASTGAKLWSFTTVSAVESSPAVVNGVVYIGAWGHVSGGNISGGNVYALNASTGAKLELYHRRCCAILARGSEWRGLCRLGRLQRVCTEREHWRQAVELYHRRRCRFLARSGEWSGLCRLGLQRVCTEREHRRQAVELYHRRRCRILARVVNGVVYIGSMDGNLYALNASAGALLWSYDVGTFSGVSPSVANGVVYVGSTNATNDTTGTLYALNASTGAKLWSYTVVVGGFLFSSPAVANGIVYAASDDGSLYALNATTGAKLWSYAIGGHDISSPTIVNGVVYIRSGFGDGNTYAFAPGFASADLFLRIRPTTTTVHQGDLLTFAFPVWDLGPDVAEHEVLMTQVPEGTTFDYIRISGTPGLGTCTHPPYGGTGQIICHEGDGMAPNTTWTVRLTVKVTAPSGTTITENAATMTDTPDPNLANNTATMSLTVQ